MWFLWKLTHFLTLTQLYCKQHAPVCLWDCCCTSESGAERQWWCGGGKDPLTRGWRAAALGCHPLSGCFQTTNRNRGEKRRGQGRESIGSVSEVIIDSHIALSSAVLQQQLVACGADAAHLPKGNCIRICKNEVWSEWPQIDCYYWKENDVIACE